MKKIIKEFTKHLLSDRYLTILIIVLLLFAIISSVIIGFSIHPSEIKVVSHYSAFGVTHYYKDQWLYLFSLVVFVLVSAAMHAIISVKLLITKGRPLAVMFACAGLAVVFVGLVTALSLLNFRNLL